jgi:uncharacterized protein (DUF362 family)
MHWCVSLVGKSTANCQLRVCVEVKSEDQMVIALNCMKITNLLSIYLYMKNYFANLNN